MDISIAGADIAGGGRSPRLLGIAGTLRRDSLNRKLLAEAAETAAPGAEVEVWDELKLVPPFDEDDEDRPADSVVALHEAIASSGAHRG
jgi:chromate reductase, NAD(P)H dehydrogenase (quinone)